jgi:hypothetical protein
VVFLATCVDPALTNEGKVTAFRLVPTPT